jgi:hypothetical protein
MTANAHKSCSSDRVARVLADHQGSGGSVVVAPTAAIQRKPGRLPNMAELPDDQPMSPRAQQKGRTRDASSPQMAFDSAEHLFAAFPILLAIANWTGRLGRVYIKECIRTGKTREARRNATIMVVVAIAMFLLLIATVIWLAKL